MAPREYVPYGEGIDLTLDLLERSPVPTLVMTADHTIRYVNGELESLFGYSRADLVGRPYEDLFPERLRATLRERIETFFTSARPEPIAFRPDFTAMRKDGVEFPMQYVALPVENRHGLWVVVNIFDRTAERQAEERIRTLNRAYLTLARMNQAAGRAATVSELFADTCRVAVEEGGFLGAWVGQVDAAGVVEPVAVCGEIVPYVATLQISLDPDDPSSRGPTGTALREGRLVCVDDFAADARTAPWQQAAAAYGIASSVALPLRRAGRPVAVLNLYAARPGGFDEETRDLLEGLAYNVSFALDGFDRAHRLEELSWQRRQLLQRLVRAEESERHRIAADIHDESVQALAAAELRLSGIETSARTGAPELAPLVAGVREILGTTMGSLRELMFDLEPSEADTPLGEALQEAAAQVFVDSNVQWDVRVESRPMERVRRTQALRIAKEALINVRKHACATRAEVEAWEAGPGMLFRVRDNGRGFEQEEGSRPGHRGLRTMRERAELAGGWFRSAPTPGGGTEVEWWLPADEEG